MADPQRKTNLLWILVIALLAVLLVIWFLAPASDDDFLDEAETEMAVPGVSPTVAPEGGVPVELPDTPIADVPEDEQAAVPVQPTE